MSKHEVKRAALLVEWQTGRSPLDTRSSSVSYGHAVVFLRKGQFFSASFEFANINLMKIKHHFFKLSIFPIFACILGFILVSCSQHIITESEKTVERLYADTSIKHRQFVENSDSVSIDEWRNLVDQFQRVIDLKPEGKNADDALYAIGSCYLWMYETKSTLKYGAKHAITAFEKLIKQYPESRLIPDAYWWSGYCYRKFENYEQAAVQYQNLIVKYPTYKNYENALYRLAECYEKQEHVPAAIATYQAIVKNGKEEKIVKRASKKLSKLQPISAKSEREEKTEQEEKTESVSHPSLPETIDSQPPSSLVDQLGLGVHTIVIDPGHGGKDPGAVNGNGLREKEITLAIAKKLKGLLDGKYNVYLTRENDTYLTLKERTEYAIQKKADLFISLHTNSCDNSQAFGVETYYLSLASDESAKRTASIENAVAEQSINDLESLVTSTLKDNKVKESRKLAELVQESIVDTIEAKDRGVKRAPFIVLIGKKVPAILVEMGFISNHGEARALCTDSYQDKIAQAIADAIGKYIR